MTTQAEQKSQHRERKSIFINLLIATVIIGFSLVSTFFEFNNLKAKYLMATLIVAATVIAAFFIINWLKSLDEFEAQMNAKASMTALYSSLFYLPFQYLSEINLIPEIHVSIFFLFIWLVYLISIITHHYK